MRQCLGIGTFGRKLSGCGHLGATYLAGLFRRDRLDEEVWVPGHLDASIWAQLLGGSLLGTVL